MSKKVPAGRKDKLGKERLDWKALDIVHPDAAGIDVGGSEHWVAISPERDQEPVCCFDCFTAVSQQPFSILRCAPALLRVSCSRIFP